MQARRYAAVAEAGAPGRPGLADFHRMQLPIEIVAPKIEKPAEFGKIGSKIELLPAEALQQIGMIGKMVDDLGGGQPIFPGLRCGSGHFGSPSVGSRQPSRMPSTL